MRFILTCSLIVLLAEAEEASILKFGEFDPLETELSVLSKGEDAFDLNFNDYGILSDTAD